MNNHLESYRGSARIEEILVDQPYADQVELKEAWELTGDAVSVPSRIRAMNWNRVVARISTAPRLAREPRPLPRLRVVEFSSFSRFAVAASLLLFVALGYLGRPTDALISNKDGSRPVSATLRDGTQVELAPGTLLKVPEDFGFASRVVRLEGEGFFDVTPASQNDGLGFEVQTFNASVQVVGTAFNVRAWQSDVESDTRVVVEHGAVRVASSSLREIAILLERGESSMVSASGTPSDPEATDLTRAIAWRNGNLAFDSVPMGAIFDEVERLFGVGVSAPESIRRLEVSYWRESPADAGSVLADLADAIDVEVRRTANGFQVYQPGN
ncbi:MAG: ferric-dicitrate binding protein FerR (iron transport regulator) [Rhodothermales bacterium]